MIISMSLHDDTMLNEPKWLALFLKYRSLKREINKCIPM